jgi:hypothetical protein
MPGKCPFLLSFESLAQLRCTLNVNFLTRHNLARSMRLVIPTLLESTPKREEIEAPWSMESDFVPSKYRTDAFSSHFSVSWDARLPLSSLALAQHTERLSLVLEFVPWVFFDRT